MKNINMRRKKKIRITTATATTTKTTTKTTTIKITTTTTTTTNKYTNMYTQISTHKLWKHRVKSTETRKTTKRLSICLAMYFPTSCIWSSAFFLLASCQSIRWNAPGDVSYAFSILLFSRIVTNQRKSDIYPQKKDQYPLKKNDQFPREREKKDNGGATEKLQA